MDECARLGPLLGGLPGCDGACDTLSRIVRSIACSDLRRHLEAKERRFQVCAPLRAPPQQPCLPAVQIGAVSRTRECPAPDTLKLPAHLDHHVDM